MKNAPLGLCQVDVFGAVLKRHVQSLRRAVNSKVELVFLVDESSSVGAANFDDELKFVKKLLADFTVDVYTTRVAVVTFSSPNRVRRHVDYLTSPSSDNHKCALKHDHLPRVNYAGGSTYTRGAMLEAEVSTPHTGATTVGPGRLISNFSIGNH